jgi:hypothetical protein
MTNRWIAHTLLVTPAAHRAVAAGLMAQVTGAAADASPESFSIALTELLAGGEVTHYACHTRIREQTLAALPDLALAIPGALWVVTAHDDDTSEQAAARMDMLDWLATQGLALHTSPDEDTP